MSSYTVDVSSLRIRIPAINYNTTEFDYLTPTPQDQGQDQDQDHCVIQVNFQEDDDDDPFQEIVKRFRTPTPHPEPPEHRPFSFYYHTGRVSDILPSPPKTSVVVAMGGLVPSHMTLAEYWKSQLDLTDFTEEDLMPPIDWIETA